jgi:hypothetical protein
MRRFLYVIATLAIFQPVGASAESAYFPGQAKTDFDAAVERGNAHLLKQLREPSLCCNKSMIHTYRFTWLRTFDHPVVIRLAERPNKSWQLTVKVADGQSGFVFDNLELIQNDSKTVTPAQVSEILAHFNLSAPFWRMPKKGKKLVSDGSTWIVEGRSGLDYHYVSRRSPKSGEVHKIGLLFLTASGLQNQKIY